MSKWSTNDRGSNASRHIEEAWALLRILIPRLPQVVIVLLDTPARVRRLGHFAHSTWDARGGQNAHEIGISPQLFDDPGELLGTLLHEAAHAVNFAEGIHDCSGRYYHLKEFRDRCVQLGLMCGFHNTRYGWCLTSWHDGQVPERYGRVIELLRAIPKGAGRLHPGKPPEGQSLPKSGHVRLVCGCLRVIHATRNVANQGAIACAMCGHNFREAEPVCKEDSGKV